MSAPVYLQIVIGLALFALIFGFLERALPLRNQQPFRRGWFTDVKYFALGCFVGHFSNAASLAAMIVLRHITGLHELVRQPGWLQFLEIVILSDFLAYLFHRLMHANAWLWRFHRIHHSSLEMDWLVNARVHPVDKILADCFQFIPILCLGFGDVPLLAYAIFLGFQGFLNHANIRLNYGPLRWLIASPQFHHWHHSDEAAAHNKNFAPHLVIFDLLFGTALIPSSQVMPARYGVAEFIPDGFVDQIIHPFR